MGMDSAALVIGGLAAVVFSVVITAIATSTPVTVTVVFGVITVSVMVGRSKEKKSGEN